MKWLALLLQVAVLNVSLAADEGKSIYLEGKSGNDQVIKAYINDLESGAPLACVNCHRESGMGTSESGKTIPPISWYFLGSNQPADNSSRFFSIQNKRKAYTKELLHRMLITGVNSNGAISDSLMPRYVISQQQTGQLIDYLKTLYTGSDPGVDADVIKIATIIDPRLPQLQQQQHLQFLRGLFDMKNSLTRGELKRKKYSPIQKAPQYESYRKWELVTWVLPENPELWKAALSDYYREQPVFVVLSSIIKNDYDDIGMFCSEMKIPCLLTHGADTGKGDYYNLVYRDSRKQQRDYLAKKIREVEDNLYYLDQDGQFLAIQNSKIKLPYLTLTTSERYVSQFKDKCGEEGTLIIKPNIKLARKLYDLDCPVKQQMKIKMVMDATISFQNISEFLSSNSDPDICWVSDYSRMLNRNTRKIRTDVLTRKFKMENNDSESLGMDLYAYGLLNDAIHQLAGNFSRSYLMEIIEHMLNSFPNYTYFNKVTGAPYQRAIVGPISEYCSTSGNSR